MVTTLLYRVLVMLVPRKVNAGFSSSISLVFVVFLFVFWLIRSLVDPTTDWLAQLAEHWTTVRGEVASSNPGRINTQGL